jgi:heat-inducible transcriptional repressor
MAMSKLNERQKNILFAIIQSHIDLNAPIGSVMIARRHAIQLSPATIRNTMASLEKLGYIIQPHTSAGRVPTDKGYSLYVSTILKEHPKTIGTSLYQKLSAKLNVESADSSVLLKEAAKSLSFMSQYLAIATPPKMEEVTLCNIKFIKYRKQKVLTVLISGDGTVKNRIIELDTVYTQSELDRAAEYMNNRFCGETIDDVKKIIANELHRQKIICNQLVTRLIAICTDIFVSDLDILSLNSLSGASNLPDFATAVQIKEILRAIEDKNFILKLLDRVSPSKGVKVVVGMQDFLPAMRELSLVIASYESSLNACGAIGVIGPTRMNYKEMISMVDYTAQTLSNILSDH